MTTALITGASNGIGLELAKIHAAKGGNLVLVARNKAKLDERCNTLRHSLASKVASKLASSRLVQSSS